MSLPTEKSKRIRRPLLPTDVRWPERGRAIHVETAGGASAWFLAAAALVLGVGLIGGQLLFGGYGFLVFSLPLYFAAGVAAILGGVGVLIRGTFHGRLGCLILAGALGVYILWRNLQSENVFPMVNAGFLFGACGLCYLLLAALSDPSQRLIFWGFFFVAALCQSGLALVQVLNDPTMAPMEFLSVRYAQWMSHAVTFRATGFHVNPNALAWTLNFAALLSVSAAWWTRLGYVVRILLFYVAAASMAMLVFTASRGGILSFAMGAGVLLLLSFIALIAIARRQGPVLGMVGIAVFVLAGLGGWLVYTFHPAIRDRFDRLFQSSDRIEVAENAFRLFLDHPLIGLGPGGFVYESRRFWKSDWWDFAHNDWAQLLSEYGWIGFSLVALFFVFHLWNGLGQCVRLISGRLRSSERGKSNSFALLAPAVALLCAAGVHSFFDFNTQISSNAFLLAAVLGMLATGAGSGRWLAWPAGVVLILGGVLMLFSVYRVAPGEWHLLQADNATGHGDYQTAMIEAQKGLDSNPRHSRLWYMRAIADRLDAESLSDMNEYLARAEKSAQALQTAAQLEPGEVTYDLSLIPVWDLLGKSDRARDLFYSVLPRAPFSGKTYLAYAKHLESLGNIKRAAIYYQIALRFPGGSEARQQLRDLEPLLKAAPKKKPASP